MCEMPKCYSLVSRKANKDHTCCECRGIINKGEQYNYHSGVWDEPGSHKVCIDCDSIRDELNSDIDYYCEKIWLGGLQENILNSQCAGEHYKPMHDLAAVMKKRSATIPSWISREMEKTK